MFKRTLKFAAALLAASVVLTACGGMNGVQAQTIALTYKDVNNVPFNIETAKKIVGYATYVNVTDSTGYNALNYTDSSSLLYTKIISDPVFLAKWLQIGTTKAWVNPTHLRSVTCYASKTTINYVGIQPDTLADNCAFFAYYQSRAN